MTVKSLVRRVPSVLALAMCVVALGLMLATPSASPAAVGKGIEDNRLERVSPDPALVDEIVGQMAAGSLQAGWTKIAIDWAALEPREGEYNETYFASLDSILSKLHAKGIKVILTEYMVPRWASDSSLWNSPPSQDDEKGYKSLYAPTGKGIQAFGNLGTELATRFGQYDVLYECWNEPNLYYFLYPQTKPGDSYFGARTYLSLLKAFHAGVKKVLPGDESIVIAGANSPRGGDDAVSTSPMRFAKYLKTNQVLNYCDAYSQHPYQTGGKSYAPNQPPPARSSVTMGNIKQLLQLFPRTPFYLTEYGYSTFDTNIGLVRVSETKQADYLRQAYALAKRYPQIKVLIWYLIKDSGPYVKTEQYNYIYTGLQRHDDRRKASWYAFAGGNKLTLSAPSSVRRSSRFTVSGSLTTRDSEWRSSKKVQLQTRTSSKKSWTTLKTLPTSATGSFSFNFLRQTTTRKYRVLWPGICASPQRTVRLR